MTDHAKYSPSSISRTLKCTGSMTIPKREQTDTSAADEGTAFHEYCEKLLRGKLAILDYCKPEGE